MKNVWTALKTRLVKPGIWWLVSLVGLLAWLAGYMAAFFETDESELLPRIKRQQHDYEDYRKVAKDCDLALWEPTSWWGNCIANGTGGPFSHITAVMRWNGRLMNVGYEEGKGGFAAPFRHDVERYGGKIHIFRADAKFDRAAVSAALINNLGFDYAWSNIKLIALTHSMGLRLFQPAWLQRRIIEASHKTGGGICSQHVARSFAADGVRFIGKQLAVTTPNDIGMSAIATYICTPYVKKEAA